MRVLDLYCGVGGASSGYARAGFTVVGVDIADQPDYPFGFYGGDAIEVVRSIGGSFDFIHASPPCQRYTAITKGTNRRMMRKYPDLMGPTREALEAVGVPYVIENPAARADVVLCGETFGLRVIRHRNFELGGWRAEEPEHAPHRGKVIGMRHGVRITEETGGYYYAVYGAGGYKGTVPQWQDAMGIKWTDNRKSIAEAIPPAYTEYIGQQFNQWRKNHG